MLTASDILQPNRKYKADTLRALKTYRRLKPWRGDAVRRAMKLMNLHNELNRVYGRETRLAFDPAMLAPNAREAGQKASGSSFYRPSQDLIVIRGRISVVTYLHEYAHALGYRSERGACRWSVNLFARIFPRSFARCRWQGHMLIRVDSE